MTFEELYGLLKKKIDNDTNISLLIGISPYRPSRYLGPDACGLPVQAVVGIYKHLTYKGEKIMIGYKSFERMESDRKQFEGLIGDNVSKRILGWYKGSSEFSLDVYYE